MKIKWKIQRRTKFNKKKYMIWIFKITTNESLSVGIENFQSLIFSHFNMLEKYISTLNTDIINPLNALQETILKKLNTNYKETISAEKNYESYITQIYFTRNKSTLIIIKKDIFEITSGTETTYFLK